MFTSRKLALSKECQHGEGGSEEARGKEGERGREREREREREKEAESAREREREIWRERQRERERERLRLTCIVYRIVYGPDGQLLDTVYTEPAVKLDAMLQRICRHLHSTSRTRFCTHDTRQPPLASRRFVQHLVPEAMSVVVDVSLISGKTVSVEAGLHESVATLKRRAQAALVVGNGRLQDSGGFLDDELTVKEAQLETGTSLTLQLRRV